MLPGEVDELGGDVLAQLICFIVETLCLLSCLLLLQDNGDMFPASLGNLRGRSLEAGKERGKVWGSA